MASAIPVFTMVRGDGQYFNDPSFVVEDVSSAINTPDPNVDPLLIIQNLLNTKYPNAPYLIVTQNIPNAYPALTIATFVRLILNNVPFSSFWIGQSGYNPATGTQLGAKTTSGPNFIYNPVSSAGQGPFNITAQLMTASSFNSWANHTGPQPGGQNYVLSGDGNANLISGNNLGPSGALSTGSNFLNSLGRSIGRGVQGTSGTGSSWLIWIVVIAIIVVFVVLLTRGIAF